MTSKSALCALCAVMLLTAKVVGPLSVVHAASLQDHPTTSATVSVTTSIERLDPAVNRIVPAQPVLERIATGFRWTEGPLWLPSGSLIFAEIPSNSIRIWNPARGVSIFMQPSGYKGPAPYGGPEPGSNGMTLDAFGRLTSRPRATGCLETREHRCRGADHDSRGHLPGQAPEQPQ